MKMEAEISPETVLSINKNTCRQGTQNTCRQGTQNATVWTQPPSRWLNCIEDQSLPTVGEV